MQIFINSSVEMKTIIFCNESQKIFIFIYISNWSAYFRLAIKYIQDLQASLLESDPETAEQGIWIMQPCNTHYSQQVYQSSYNNDYFN